MTDYLEIPDGDISKVSDGYHTFEELYSHRNALFCVLLNCIEAVESHPDYSCLAGNYFLYPWKSKLHNDGTMFEGDWFIAGVSSRCNKFQLTYHLEYSKYWDLLPYVVTLEKAPPYDGHSSDDVINRLLSLIP